MIRKNNLEKNSPHAFPLLNSAELPGNGSVLMADQAGQCAPCHNKPRPH